MSDSVILTALRRSRLAVSEEIARLARELADLDAAISTLDGDGPERVVETAQQLAEAAFQSNEAAVRVDPSDPAYQAPEEPAQPEEPLGVRLQREAADFEAAERAKREEARVDLQGSVPAPQLVQAAPQAPVEQQGSEDTPPWVQQAQQPAAPTGEKKRRSNDDIAAEHGVALADVKAWKDANGGGRVVKADIEQYAKLVKEHAASQQAAAQPEAPQEQAPPAQQGIVPAPQFAPSQPIAADQPLQPHDEKAFRANPQQFAPTPAPQPAAPPVQFAPPQATFTPPQMQLPPGFAPTGFSPS